MYLLTYTESDKEFVPKWDGYSDTPELAIIGDIVFHKHILLF